MASKLQCREVFWKQPAYYLFLDATPPMNEETFEQICSVVTNITSLALCMEGSPRISTMGICYISSEFQTIFPMQALKSNFGKLFDALENVKNNFSIFGCHSRSRDWKLYIDEAIQCYKRYFEDSYDNPKDWPPLQITILSAQKIVPLTKAVRKALSSNEKKICLKKIQVVNLYIEDCRPLQHKINNFYEEYSENNTPEIDEDVNTVLEVVTIDNNVIQLEMIFKMWLHDSTTESEHLKIKIKNDMVIHCDIREFLLNPDFLPGSSNFTISADTGFTQLVRPNHTKQDDTRIQIYQLETTGFVARSGICQSTMFGLPIILRATQCWKMEWDQLQTNQQIFNVVKQYLDDHQLVMLTKKFRQPLTKNDTTPTGHFSIFPTKSPGIMLLMPIASREHLMPCGQDHVLDSSMPEDLVKEMTEIFETFEVKDVYNPLTASAGLYEQLVAIQMKSRPVRKKNKVARKSKKNITPTAVSSEKSVLEEKPQNLKATEFKDGNRKVVFGPQFIKASELMKKKFVTNFNE